ncbi:MAG: AAA family ATPase [Deltaproteobacteria bacterium]|nr:AAA family ATPase [Deltaproteobacteria bacterium]
MRLPEKSISLNEWLSADWWKLDLYEVAKRFEGHYVAEWQVEAERLPRIEQVVRDLQELGGKMVKVDYETPRKEPVRALLMWFGDGGEPRAIVELGQGGSRGAFAELHAVVGPEAHAEAERILAVLERGVASEVGSTPIRVLVNQSYGAQAVYCGSISGGLVRENYVSEVVSAADVVVREYSAEAPFGRLVLVQGEPGTGKTYLVRGILNQIPDADVLLIPPSLTDALVGPNLISSLNEARRRRMILVFEDADQSLTRREADNVGLVSSLLNLSDGLLSHSLDVRIIATCNARRADIDPALLRPGRMLRNIVIEALTVAKAEEIFQRLVGPGARLPRPLHTLAEVYEAAREAAEP